MTVLNNLICFILFFFASISDSLLTTAGKTTIVQKKSVPVVIFMAKRGKLRVKKTRKRILFDLHKFKQFFKKRLRKQPFEKKQKLKPKHNKSKSSPLFPLPFFIKIRYFLIGLLFSFFFLFLPLLFFLFIQDLPNPKTLTIQQIPQTTKIFDRHGKLLYQIYATQNRTLIHLNEIPNDLINATLAIEDKNFYKHPGFDLASMIRAFRENVSGRSFQGGSTITQQLIKSSLLTPEPSITRKVKEVILAFWAERMYRKNQILEMYFNQVPYGGTAWGVEAASEVYFEKKVKDLTLPESAFLAGMTAAPTTFSPYGQNPTLWKRRQKEVLGRMVMLGYITNKQKKGAENTPLRFNTPQDSLIAPHFVNYVKDYLVNKYGILMVERGGLQVITSLDLSIQDMAQKIVSDEVAKNEYLNLTNGAALVTNPANGDILAMVGSKEYNDEKIGKVNITTRQRQPGSSIKPVTYAAALTKGVTAATILEDIPITYNPGDGSLPYTPVNYDGAFHGRVPLRFALANSLNIPAVRTLNRVGIPTMVALAKNMGITTWNEPTDYGLSLTLGSAEVKMTDMATVYGTLANQGEKVVLNPLLQVTNFRGTVLEKKDTIEKKQIIPPGVAFILSDILSDNQARSMEFGLNSPLVIPKHTVAVKTGTSDNKRDNWTFGYTQNFLVAVWVGNNDNSPMSQNLASGITGAAPIWHRIMEILLTKQPEQQPRMPEDIVSKNCYGKNEYFIRGTENSINCATSPYFRFPSPTRQ